MKPFYLLLVVSLLPTFCFAQYQLNGYVLNQAEEVLPFASVVVLQKKDSSIFAFGMTNEDGLFKIDISKQGNYFLQYSYVGHTSSYYQLNNEWKDKKITIPTVRLKKSTVVLKEVSVEAERIPMGVKGDTIVYDPKAFKTREGASVEDLLKRLPGIQVGKDGSIKAQGEDVKKVLVDGKEFFGNDPRIATKNLEAEAIDKVEVFDKKSEIAEFTGVDDGQEEKTINLTLKEDYKKGTFGRLTAAAGSQETFAGKLNYNRFNTKSQLSLISNSNNINKQAFSLQDYMGFLGGIGQLSNMSAGMLSATQNSNKGINTAHSIGTNLNHSFNEKISLNANYFYLRNGLELRQQTASSNFSGEDRFGSEEVARNNQIDQNHRLDSKLKWKLNPMNALSFYNNFRGVDRSTDDNTSTTFTPTITLLNQTTRKLANEEQQFSWNSRLLFKKKFSKKGRSWISDISYEKAKADQNNNIDNNSFGQQLIQFQDFETDIEKQNIASTYTEPLAKKWYGSISYKYARDWSNPIRDFFDISENNEVFNDELSGDFKRLTNTHSSSIRIKRNSKKLKFNISGTSEHIQLTTGGPKRSFHYILPGTSFKWKMKNSKSLSFAYQTNVKIPTLSQLITIPNNLNPNQNYIGNSKLNPEYSHNVSLQYNMFDSFNFSSIFLTLMAEKVENKIVDQTTVNPDLTTNITPVNSDFYESISSFISVTQPIKPLKIITKLGGNSRWSRYNAWLNGQATQIAEQNYTANFSFERKKKEKWDYRIGMNLSWTERTYEINKDFDQNFANYDWFIDLDWEPKEDLLLTLGYILKRYNDVFFSSEEQLHFINATARKSFNNDKWAIEFTANDILNQTIGLNRTGTDNSLQEERFNTRAQYFMLGLSVKLGKKKKQSL